MLKEAILEYIEENNLSLFNGKTRMRGSLGIFKTVDAKLVHGRLVEKLSKEFCFDDSESLLNFFSFTQDLEEIKRRQDFFKAINPSDNELLKKLSCPKAIWKPKYDVLVVTEDESTFIELKKLNCPVRYITSEEDLKELEDCDIVQVLECEQFKRVLETLPQSVILDSLDEAYLERYLEQLSGWNDNMNILKEINNDDIKKIVDELSPLFLLIGEKNVKKYSKDEIEKVLEEINSRISERIKGLSISGEVLVQVLSKRLPAELEKIAEEEIKTSGLPEHLFCVGIPVCLEEQEVNRFMKHQSAEEHTSVAEAIKKHARLLKEVPEKLRMLENLVLYYDFMAGVYKFVKEFNSFPVYSNEFLMENSKNVFLTDAQAVSFKLDESSRCSILTGANSGGKTTLLEHILQLISLSNFGLPVSGKLKLPLFTEIYYFAKNKGSMSKGAFETLLGQMAEIKTGRQTLILADEMEAVTEPGVAGKIVNATAEFFINKGCFLIIATHLGQEIQKHLPKNARVDGIEAKGLDENFELIIDRNPILGKIASSTPELIVEKLANTKKEEYFAYLHNYLRNSN